MGLIKLFLILFTFPTIMYLIGAIIGTVMAILARGILESLKIFFRYFSTPLIGTFSVVVGLNLVDKFL